MKVTEVKYTKRFNLGNYEHEEFGVTAVLDENDQPGVELLMLQEIVHATQNPGAEPEKKTTMQDVVSEVRAAEPTVASPSIDEAAPKKKSRKKKESLPAKNESDETISSEDDQEDANDLSSEDEANDFGGESEDDDADGEKEAEEQRAPVKGKKSNTSKQEVSSASTRKEASTDTSSTSPTKGTKAKMRKLGTPYSRGNELHRKIFGEILDKKVKGWRKGSLFAKAKQVSREIDGTEFMDADGKVMRSFETKLVEMMQ